MKRNQLVLFLKLLMKVFTHLTSVNVNFFRRACAAETLFKLKGQHFRTLFLTWAGVPMGKPRRSTMQGVLEIKRTR